LELRLGDIAGDERPVRRLRKDFAGSVDEGAAGGGVTVEAVEGVLETADARRLDASASQE
jgi:hypothetical protein